MDTGCLIDVQGALVPSDELMDKADRAEIHTVIPGRLSAAVIDIRSGEQAFRDADEATRGGALYVGGALRGLSVGSDGRAFLDGDALPSQPLARLRSTARSIPLSRSIVWGLARQINFDPTRWRLAGSELITWGGETFNLLMVALVAQQAPTLRLTFSATCIAGLSGDVDLSLNKVKSWAREAEAANNLPLEWAAKFCVPTRFFGQLSPALASEENRRAVPWRPFRAWLDRIVAIDPGTMTV